ncbi:tRNA (mnm(5)s(2)U34)-methyltransferase [Geobacter pickeringii]|uniref:rRNA methyltransferase n=1 Tax=Geobacter pickeringii TaxID=345632 RepID=A0A0B5BC81_9BACT|nr:class I SAM-dependent methyltransferase [Geobacter pickeringii]AJE02659.1 rRNA methyltransferase [Geobacter pickeringii]
MKGKGLFGAVPLAHAFLRERVREGDRVVDATCGNGHDTAFLAELVGDAGTVWAFDIQEGALAATEARLAAAGYRGRAEFIPRGHEQLAAVVSGPVRAVVFNLGYLPGGEKETVTAAATTRAALEQAAALLLPGGIVTVAVYTGHPGGAEEGRVVEEWAAALPPARFNVWRCRQLNRPETAPYLVAVERVPA